MLSSDAVLIQVHRNRMGIPDLIAVLLDGAIRGKLSHSDCVEDRHPLPFGSILVSKNARTFLFLQASNRRGHFASAVLRRSSRYPTGGIQYLVDLQTRIR